MFLKVDSVDGTFNLDQIEMDTELIKE